MNIRRGEVSDAEACAALIDSFRSILCNQPDGVGAEKFLESVSTESETSYLESERYKYFVAEDNGKVLGFIACRDGSHIFHLFVARDHQRKGLARQLWEKVKSCAFDVVRPERFTVNSSLGAVGVYHSFGFEACGEVVSAHGISFLPMQLFQGKHAA